MGLRLKFNLVLLLVFILGLAVTGYLSHELLRKNAKDEVLRNAGVMMEAALSMRGYTNTQIRPLIPHNDSIFHPQSVPAYSATEIMNALRKKYEDYSYKEATLNPTNPRNKAVEWESDIVNVFRNDPARTERSGIRQTPSRAPPPSRPPPRPAFPATIRRTRRRPRWSRSMDPTMGSAGSTWKWSARKSFPYRCRCRSRTRIARS